MLQKMPSFVMHVNKLKNMLFFYHKKRDDKLIDILSLPGMVKQLHLDIY